MTPIPEDKTLAQMLATGEIDAFHTARMPSTFDGKNVVRLFPDFVTEEKAYYKKTGIFPIMHTVVIKRDVYEKNRWIAQTLMKAFLKAQHLTYERQRQTAAHVGMLPWFNAHVEEAREPDGRRLLAVRLREERRDAGDVPQVPPPVRALEAAAEARRTCSRRRRWRASRSEACGSRSYRICGASQCESRTSAPITTKTAT